MAAAATDLLQEIGLPGSATNLAGSGYTIGASSITVTTTTNHPTATGYTFAMDVVEIVNGVEVRVEGTYCEFVGVVTSGTTIGSVSKVFGDAQNYSAGATTRVYIPVSSERENRIVEWGSVFANQDGSLKSAPVQAALGISGGAGDGWSILNAGTAPTVATGYNKGNKEYDLTFSGVDLTSVLSPGMRLKLTRGTTAPTQCVDLESTSSQYASKTSPTGISFTDNPTCEAWIKLESYTGATQTIVARRNGTSGSWLMYINASGQLAIEGGSTSVDVANTYQSVPLNQWVHVAATINISGTTATTYINGVSVPNTYTNSAITAITQSGDLRIGNTDGSIYFDGKIADVRVWSVARTATQIRDNMNQQLVGNETNLVAYYKLNGNLNDSTSNANNLTGSGGAVATTVDNPMNSVEYGIITKVAFSTNTTATVFTGTNHNIPNMTLSNPYYSGQDTPFGFPREKEKWRVSSIIQATQAVTSNANFGLFINGGWSLAVPTGSWDIGWQAQVYSTTTTAVYWNLSPTSLVGLTSAAGSLTSRYVFIAVSPTGTVTSNTHIRAPQSVASQTNYTIYTSGSTTGSGLDAGSAGIAEIFAECGFL